MDENHLHVKKLYKELLGAKQLVQNCFEFLFHLWCLGKRSGDVMVRESALQSATSNILSSYAKNFKMISQISFLILISRSYREKKTMKLDSLGHNKKFS